MNEGKPYGKAPDSAIPTGANVKGSCKNKSFFLTPHTNDNPTLIARQDTGKLRLTQDFTKVVIP